MRKILATVLEALYCCILIGLSIASFACPPDTVEPDRMPDTWEERLGD
jgi:hypothetical protein